ncbi:MAG: hypothetical protein IJX88_05965 [Clostridia bacterium]|nr:hypothetical protein [Clostridia bacterium]
MKKKISIAILACLSVCCTALGVACAKENALTPAPALPSYNESGFGGTGIVGVPSLLDMVGYGTLSSYEFFDDGSVALASKFFVPLKNSGTKDGFTASLTLERNDGVFDVMTEAANTGALYVLTDDTGRDISTRYRIYVVGVDEETSYLVISGAEKHVYDSNYDYYERRYLIPLGGYCTGAPLEMQVVYYQNAYYITLTTEDGDTVFKKIDKDTAFTENPSYSSEMKSFFEDVERVLGLESLDMQAKFSSVDFTLGNDKAQSLTGVPQHTITQINATTDGGTLIVSDEKPDKGEAVTVTVKPNAGYYLDTFTVDGENRKYRLSTAENGAYEYELIGVQKDTTVEVSYAAGVEQTYTVTGRYAYTSGTYNPTTNAFENVGDEVAVQAGIYSGTAKDGEFSIELPKGYYEIELASEKFPAAKTALTVEGATDIGEVQFTRLNFTEGISYNADGSLTFSANQTNRLFDEAAADEGFVVNYTVQGSQGGWFNTGGLYIYNEDLTFDFIFVYHSGANAQIVFIDSNYKWNNGPTYLTTHTYPDCREKLDVTVIYYQEQYHIILDNEYRCTIDKNTKLDTTQGTLGDDYFVTKPRQLGLRNYDSAATFTNVSYGLGNAAALKAMERLNVSVKANVSTGGAITLYKGNGEETELDAQQALGEIITAEIIPDSGKVISEFTVNGKDSKYLLQGPFNRDGQVVYKYKTSAHSNGLNMYAAFAETQTTYKVTGTYFYADGASSENVSITANGALGTASNGAFEIALPDGTHVLTLTDESGRQATKQITVKGQNVNVGELVFQNVKFVDGANVSEVENGYKVTAGYNLLDNVIASEGFVLKYTVKGVDSSRWFNSGAVYFEMNGVTYSIVVMAGDSNHGGGGNAILGLQQGDLGANSVDNYYTNIPYTSTAEEMQVQIVYYQNTFFIKLGGYSALAISASNRGFTNSNFYKEGYRTIGFRAWDEAGTFTNISYALGNAFAEKELQNMSLDYSVGKASRTLLLAKPTAAAGEGFVMNFTLGASTNSGAWFNNGGLYVQLGDGRYHFVTFNTNNKSTLRISMYDSVGAQQNNLYYNDVAYTGAEAVSVQVAYYKGAYYIKFGTTTLKFDASTNYAYVNESNIFDETQTRSIGFAARDCAANFSNVTYSIGNTSAKSAVQAMGFTVE